MIAYLSVAIIPERNTLATKLNHLWTGWLQNNRCPVSMMALVLKWHHHTHTCKFRLCVNNAWDCYPRLVLEGHGSGRLWPPKIWSFGYSWLTHQMNVIIESPQWNLKLECPNSWKLYAKKLLPIATMSLLVVNNLQWVFS